MINFKLVYKLSFYSIPLITFVFGGVFQFFFGASNTILTFFLTGFLFFVYFIYVLLKQRLILNHVVCFSFLYATLIFITAIIMQSNVIATLTYLIFPLLPLAVYFFNYINYKENYISFQEIFKLFFYIAIIQLPVLLVQKYFYSFFIRFNNSGQQIEWFDFMFGTFFIKSDHSLGIFLLLIIAIILFKGKEIERIVKHQRIAIIYLSVTLLLTESNISKLFLIVILSTFIIVPVYKKYGSGLKFKIGAAFLALFILLGAYMVRNEEFVKNRLGGTLERQFSLENAEKYYELETAKRFQIIIVAFKKLETKWIGDGPYSYFDILTGKFKKTRHFTQLIWTYFDLGLIGLFIVFGYIFSLTLTLEIEKGIPILFFLGMFLVYSLYTTIFSDIAIIFGVFTLLNKRRTWRKIEEKQTFAIR